MEAWRKIDTERKGKEEEGEMSLYFITEGKRIRYFLFGMLVVMIVQSLEEEIVIVSEVMKCLRGKCFEVYDNYMEETKE